MMQEFLFWRNCTNKCDFCWQCKNEDAETFLNEKEMLECIAEVSKKLDTLRQGDDVLMVGGEIMNSYYPSVDTELRKLFDKTIKMIAENNIRYFYLNTNLIYENVGNLTYVLNKIKGYEDRLKFTTSFDVYGRFKTDKSKELFLRNLAYIRDEFPKVNVVVNCIITKQLVETDFDYDAFKNEYNISYINFIPYIPVQDDRSMDVTFRDIVKVLSKCEREHKGYIDFYINDFDLNQDKVLYEYRKSQGFVECTAEYSECHHNENFKKVLGGECYICKLKEMFR